MTQPERIEEPMLERTVTFEEYEKLRKELEDFAYIVSHDLNAPVRHAREFSKLLISKLGGNVGEQEQQYVEYIIRATTRIENMLSGMLDYSRLNTKAESFVAVGTNHLIQAIEQSLKQKIVETHTTITYGELPDLFGDRRQLHTLFYHLLDNAIKFQPKEQKPLIHLSLVQKDNQWECRIRDNGIGVSERYRPNLFRMFKQENPDMAGVGVGLGLCKKIVERHGGEIWYEQPNDSQGSIFAFTLHAQ